jgi:hypothetical protein
MSNEDNEGQGVDLRERIASLILANEQARVRPMTGEELQTLKTAACRLDQILKTGAEAEKQTLSSAAARLDQLLGDIQAGKDFGGELRRRSGWKKQEE